MNNIREVHIFQGGIKPNDILQGALGDCYFLCSLAILAERPERIKKLIKTQKVTESGHYCVRVCKNGFWQDVVIDDYFPANKYNTPAFA